MEPRKGVENYNLHEHRNWLDQIEKLVVRINPTILVFQSDDQREISLRENSEHSKEVVYRDMMSFKIIKLFYNNYIYTKTF